MIAKLSIAAAILFYTAVFSTLFVAGLVPWMKKALSKKGYSLRNAESEMKTEDLFGLIRWAEANGFMDFAATWLFIYTLLVCITFAFAYMLLDGLSWYLFLIPITTVSLVALLVSLVRWGPLALGVRFSLLNLLAAGSLYGLLYWRRALQPFAPEDVAYYYRWLWSPAGAFGATIAAFWAITQPWQLLRIKGWHGMSQCCSFALFLTAAFGAVWFQFGPYPKVYLFGAYVLLGLWLIVTRLKPRIDWPVAGAGVFLISAVTFVYWGSENPQIFEQLRPFTKSREVVPIYPSLWPSANRRNPDGFLESEDGQPLRILASGPGVSLFKTKEMRYPVDVITTMEPWRRYFAFEKSESGVLIGPSRASPPEQRAWVYENECYVLRTDLGLKFNIPCQLFESLETAKLRKKQIEKSYQWRPDQHQDKEGDKAVRIPEFLPVVQTVDGTYRFVRPDGAEWGFPLCWVSDQGGNIQIQKLKDE